MGRDASVFQIQVLEEGLDVASCDLVVRFQGVNSLTSLLPG